MRFIKYPSSAFKIKQLFFQYFFAYIKSAKAKVPCKQSYPKQKGIDLFFVTGFIFIA